jgi:hypothetical protein
VSDTFQTTIERDGQEVTIEVVYDYVKGCKGTRDSFGGVRGAGPPLEPDTPPELENVWATFCDGEKKGIDVELTESELDHITDMCLEKEADKYADAMEYRYERARDDALFDESGLENIETHERQEGRQE